MSFRQWVIQEYGERHHDPVSDLAADLIYDDCWPAEDTHRAGRQHLEQGHGACTGALECFERAWSEYRAQKGSNR